MYITRDTRDEVSQFTSQISMTWEAVSQSQGAGVWGECLATMGRKVKDKTREDEHPRFLS